MWLIYNSVYLIASVKFKLRWIINIICCYVINVYFYLRRGPPALYLNYALLIRTFDNLFLKWYFFSCPFHFLQVNAIHFQTSTTCRKQQTPYNTILLTERKPHLIFATGLRTKGLRTTDLGLRTTPQDYSTGLRNRTINLDELLIIYVAIYHAYSSV